MTASTRIYAGGALAFGGQPAINDLLTASYNTVIVWSVHVTTDGTLILNDTQIVSGGVYKEAEPMDLPARLAQLHKAGVEIIFSVGAGGTSDFTNIATLLNGNRRRKATRSTTTSWPSSKRWLLLEVTSTPSILTTKTICKRM